MKPSAIGILTAQLCPVVSFGVDGLYLFVEAFFQIVNCT